MDAGTQLIVALLTLVVGLIYLFAQIRLFSIDKKLGVLIELQKAHAVAAGLLVGGWQCGNCGRQAQTTQQPTSKCECGYQDWRQVAIVKSATSSQ